MVMFSEHPMHCLFCWLSSATRDKKVLCENLKDKTYVTSKNMSMQSLLDTAAVYCELTGREIGCGSHTWKLVTENILESLKKKPM